MKKTSFLPKAVILAKSMADDLPHPELRGQDTVKIEDLNTDIENDVLKDIPCLPNFLVCVHVSLIFSSLQDLKFRIGLISRIFVSF